MFSVDFEDGILSAFTYTENFISFSISNAEQVATMFPPFSDKEIFSSSHKFLLYLAFSGSGRYTVISSALLFPKLETVTSILISSSSLTVFLSVSTAIASSGPSPVVKPTLSGIVVSSVVATSELFVKYAWNVP